MNQLEELKGDVKKDYIDHVLLKGYKSEYSTESEVDSPTLAVGEDFENQGKKVRYVSYYKYFTKMFEVVYDENDIELLMFPTYD